MWRGADHFGRLRLSADRRSVGAKASIGKSRNPSEAKDYASARRCAGAGTWPRKGRARVRAPALGQLGLSADSLPRSHRAGWRRAHRDAPHHPARSAACRSLTIPGDPRASSAGAGRCWRANAIGIRSNGNLAAGVGAAIPGRARVAARSTIRHSGALLSWVVMASEEDVQFPPRPTGGRPRQQAGRDSWTQPDAAASRCGV